MAFNSQLLFWTWEQMGLNIASLMLVLSREGFTKHHLAWGEMLIPIFVLEFLHGKHVHLISK